jgi:hypothetical protein
MKLLSDTAGVATLERKSLEVYDLKISDELIEELHWHEGDEIEMRIDELGQLVLSNISNPYDIEELSNRLDAVSNKLIVTQLKLDQILNLLSDE